ncbi:unnamed protein product [Spodoptera exigua]|nr:unnamed protein product [Spodoptera exigua]
MSSQQGCSEVDCPGAHVLRYRHELRFTCKQQLMYCRCPVNKDVARLTVQSRPPATHLELGIQTPINKGQSVKIFFPEHSIEAKQDSGDEAITDISDLLKYIIPVKLNATRIGPALATNDFTTDVDTHESKANNSLILGVIAAVILVVIIAVAVMMVIRKRSSNSGRPQMDQNHVDLSLPFYLNLLFRKECNEQINYTEEEHHYEEIS